MPRAHCMHSECLPLDTPIRTDYTQCIDCPAVMNAHIKVVLARETLSLASLVENFENGTFKTTCCLSLEKIC